MTQDEVEDMSLLAAALEQAVLICRSEYPKQARPSCKLWRWLSKPLRLWRLRNLDDQAIEFSRYVNFFSQQPDFWIPENSGGVGKGQMPRALAGVASMMMLGKTEEESWNYPIGLGEWMKAARSVHQGEDLDFIEPITDEKREKLQILKYSTEDMCNALLSGGDALTHAETLHQNNLMPEDCLNVVKEWQSASKAKRRTLILDLEQMIPDLTLPEK